MPRCLHRGAPPPFDYVGRVTENKIYSILTDFGTIISEGVISNILTKEKRVVSLQ
jgi:hypothetical protein